METETNIQQPSGTAPCNMSCPKCGVPSSRINLKYNMECRVVVMNCKVCGHQWNVKANSEPKRTAERNKNKR